LIEHLGDCCQNRNDNDKVRKNSELNVAKNASSRMPERRICPRNIPEPENSGHVLCVHSDSPDFRLTGSLLSLLSATLIRIKQTLLYSKFG
jgi:hypothetical protein